MLQPSWEGIEGLEGFILIFISSLNSQLKLKHREMSGMPRSRSVETVNLAAEAIASAESRVQQTDAPVSAIRFSLF